MATGTQLGQAFRQTGDDIRKAFLDPIHARMQGEQFRQRQTIGELSIERSKMGLEAGQYELEQTRQKQTERDKNRKEAVKSIEKRFGSDAAAIYRDNPNTFLAMRSQEARRKKEKHLYQPDQIRRIVEGFTPQLKAAWDKARMAPSNSPERTQAAQEATDMAETFKTNILGPLSQMEDGVGALLTEDIKKKIDSLTFNLDDTKYVEYEAAVEGALQSNPFMNRELLNELATNDHDFATKTDGLGAWSVAKYMATEGILKKWFDQDDAERVLSNSNLENLKEIQDDDTEPKPLRLLAGYMSKYIVHGKNISEETRKQLDAASEDWVNTYKPNTKSAVGRLRAREVNEFKKERRAEKVAGQFSEDLRRGAYRRR